MALLSRHRLFAALWLVLLGLGLLSFSDFGLSWDEPRQRTVGTVSYLYVTGVDKKRLHTDRDGAYGVSIELPLVFLERALGLTAKRDIYLMRHLATHLLFLLGVLCLYGLAFALFQSTWLACFCALMLWAHPRIFAHSFFNSKDVPFLVLYLFCIAAFAWAFSRRTLLAFGLLGTLHGLLLNLRILGGIFGFAVVLFGALWLVKEGPKRHRSWLLRLGLFCTVSLATLVATWPFLWRNPLGQFFLAWDQLRYFKWAGKLLFDGQIIRATEIPWSYLPHWIAITTPPLFLGLGLAGLLWLLWDLLQASLRAFRRSQDAPSLDPPQNAPQQTREASALCEPLHTLSLFALNVGLALAAVLLMKAVLYDGWRHFFYFYPLLCLSAAYVLWRLAPWLAHRSAKGAVIVALGLQFAAVFAWMYQSHPHPHVYFNAFVPRKDAYILKHWEIDYWGSSYRAALEYISRRSKARNIRVNVAHTPGKLNQVFFPDGRFTITVRNDIQGADYFISTYRYNREGYSDPKMVHWYTLRLNQSPVFSIWRRRRAPKLRAVGR